MTDEKEVIKALADTGKMDEEQAKWMLDLAQMRDEELDAELASYVYVERDWPMLKHPLVFQIPFTLPGMANRAYAQKTKALDEAVLKRQWSTVVWLHERPYRLQALIDYVIGVNEYDEPLPLCAASDDNRALAADVWVDSENINQNIDEWTALFSEWEPGDPMLFNDDPEEWAKLPDTLTVYRAGIDDGGWSWTLDPKVAVFFAKRFGERHIMTEGKVAKTNVFGYLTRRSEAEVLVLDGSVYDTRPYAGVE